MGKGGVSQISVFWGAFLNERGVSFYQNIGAERGIPGLQTRGGRLTCPPPKKKSAVNWNVRFNLAVLLNGIYSAPQWPFFFFGWENEKKSEINCFPHFSDLPKKKKRKRESAVLRWSKFGDFPFLSLFFLFGEFAFRWMPFFPPRKKAKEKGNFHSKKYFAPRTWMVFPFLPSVMIFYGELRYAGWAKGQYIRESKCSHVPLLLLPRLLN